MAPANTKRNASLDFLRSAAVISIIFLHVSLTATNQPSHTFDKVGYEFTVVASSVFTNETLIFISLLLSLEKLNGHYDYWTFLAARASRIGIPFLTFSLLYVLLDACGPQQGVLFKFSITDSIALLLAGLGEYHLHFLPALLLLTVAAPVFQRALPLAAVLFALLVGTCIRFIVEYFVFANATEASLTATQLLLLHAGKTAAYFPFGFLAQWYLKNRTAVRLRLGRSKGFKYSLLFGLFAIVGADVAMMSISFGAAGKLGIAVLIQEILGTSLNVLGIFLVYAYISDLETNESKSGIYTESYSRAFLVLMVHPFFLKVFDWAVGNRPWSFLSILLCVAFVLSASWALAGWLNRIADRIGRRKQPLSATRH